MRKMIFLAAVALASIAPQARATVPGLAAASPAFAALRSDVACMARTVYHEARGEGATGMVAVGSVALNRAAAERRTPCEIVYRKIEGRCQFSWACANPAQPAGTDWMRSLAVAEALLSRRGLPDPTRGATFFSQCGAAPADGLRQTVRIGGHCFWALVRRRVSATPLPRFALRADASKRTGWVLDVGAARESFLEVAEAR